MKTRLYITGMTLVAAMALSCCGQKVASEQESTTKAMEETTFDSTGYTQGTMVHSTEEGDCEWTIKTKDGIYFESGDLNNFKNLKKDGMNIWFKYSPLRRMSTCNKANPISLLEVEIVE